MKGTTPLKDGHQSVALALLLFTDFMKKKVMVLKSAVAAGGAARTSRGKDKAGGGGGKHQINEGIIALPGSGRSII